MERRDFLKGAAGAALVVAMPGPVRAQAKKIPLVHITPFSGALADLGPDTEIGCKVAIELLRKERKLDFDYLRVDSESNPSTAVRKMQEAASSSGARLFVGANLSSEALALGKEARNLGAIYVTSAGADEITGKDCTRSMFRWAVPTRGAVEGTIKPLMSLLPNAKRWYAITPKYVFGDALLSNTERVLKEGGAELVGNSYHSLTEKEFSGYLVNAAAANPDVLVLHNFAAQGAACLRQAVSFGLKTKMKIVMVWSAGLDQLLSLGPDILDGVYVGAQYWHTTDIPANKAFVSACAPFSKLPPNNNTAAGYAMTMAIAAGMTTNEVDTAKIIENMQGKSLDGVTGPETIRDFDHEITKSYFLLKCKPKASMANPYDLADILKTSSIYPTQAESLCRFS